MSTEGQAKYVVKKTNWESIAYLIRRSSHYISNNP